MKAAGDTLTVPHSDICIYKPVMKIGQQWKRKIHKITGISS